MIGQRIGSYRVVRLLGQGGMGAVYEAVHETLGRRAAIKVLLPSLSRDPDNTRRLFREARAASLVQHPGIVNTYEFGQLDNGTVYIVMEFLAGESLGARLKRAAGRPVPATLRICRQVASALTAAHERGVVHRDLKPDNIIIVRDPDMPGGERAKLVDFGLAKVAEGMLGSTASDVRTRTGMVVGTPRYMSPEQCRGLGAVDQKADVYSLGVVLYHMRAGHPPFRGETVGDVLAQHIRDTAPPLASADPGTSPALEALVQRMLAKEPAARPSMSEVAQQLDSLDAATPEPPGAATGPMQSQAGLPLLEAGSALVSVPARSEADVAPPPPMDNLDDDDDLDRPPRDRWQAGLLVAIVLLLCGGAAYWASRSRTHGPGPAEVAALLSRAETDLAARRWEAALRGIDQALSSAAVSAEARDLWTKRRDLAEHELNAERGLVRMGDLVGAKNYDGVMASYRAFPRDSASFQAARELYERSFPAFATLHLERARVARAAGHCKEVQVHVRLILDLEPTYKPALRARERGCSATSADDSAYNYEDLPQLLAQQVPAATSPGTPASAPGGEAPPTPATPTPATPTPATPTPPTSAPLPAPAATPMPAPALTVPTSDEERRQILRDAHAQINQGRYSSAMAMLRPLTDAPSVRTAAWSLLGVAACKGQDAATARRAYAVVDGADRAVLLRQCGERGIELR